MCLREKKSAQIREILINESAWEEMTCLFALSLVYVLEATVTEERRRLMMEIIYHKCEFVGEMTVVQQAQRQLSLASYERIEQTLKECIAAKLLPANLLTRRAAVLMRSYLSGLMENWLFAPRFVRPACGSAGLRRYSAGDVSILPDATRPGELVSLKVARGWA